MGNNKSHMLMEKMTGSGSPQWRAPSPSLLASHCQVPDSGKSYHNGSLKMPLALLCVDTDVLKITKNKDFHILKGTRLRTEVLDHSFSSLQITASCHTEKVWLH